ncbi:MAG: Bug family tripartite tricarboxylate transporter substrate binding protein [Betaproteobacteria bacterium]
MSKALISPARLVRAALCAVLAAGGSLTALAQDFPSKPIRLVVPAFVGTPIDIISRQVALRLGNDLGQPVVVDNKPGGTGIVGATEVLRQPADGYTLMTLFMPMTVAQSANRQVNYDLRRDFAPVVQTVFSYNVLVVPPSVPAKTPAELVNLLKSRPGQLNFASGGVTSPAHLAGELLILQTGTKATHVPYNAFPQAIGDLLSGRMDFMFAATPPVVGHIAAGRLRPLAVTGDRRVAALKDVPTMVESGFPDFVVRDWQGILVKAGTPGPVIERINAAVRRVVTQPETIEAMAKLGADPAAASAEEFGRLVASEVDAWGRLVKAANISME